MHLSEVPTPFVAVDRERLRRNISRIQRLTARAGMRLRPHVKTHKSPVIARWQLDAGAIGICCAKLGEAEVMAGAGITDIRLPYPVHPTNADRVLALMERAAISIIVDHDAVAREWSARMSRAGRTLDVLVKVDVGFHRCGIDPDAAGAVAFVQMVSALPGIRLRGLLSHAGHGYGAGSDDSLKDIAREEAQMLTTFRQRAVASGIVIDELSVGATPTLRYSLEEPVITELRPGNYVYFDRSQVALGSASLDDCAMTVVTTVVSKPAADRIILDCGSKTLSSDSARGFTPQNGYGWILSPDGGVNEGLTMERLSEEHATVRAAGPCALTPGDRVHVIPNHACLVANLVDEVLLTEGDTVVDRLPVAARGKIA